MTTKKMSDEKLKTIIDHELRNSLSLSSGKLVADRKKALDYYHCKPEGDLAPPSVDRRSKVVASDVADTIEWMLPSLMKIFISSDSVVEFMPQQDTDEEKAKQATDYVNYIFSRQNDGYLTLLTWFKDALLQKIGVVKVYWCDNTEVEKQTYRGLTVSQAQEILSDDLVEPIEQSGYLSEMGEELYDVVVKRKAKPHVKIDNIAPEDFFVSSRAKSTKDATFLAHRVERTLSELREMGYDNVDDIQSDPSADFISTDKLARESNDAYGINGKTYLNESMDESMRVVRVIEAYIKVDYDGDGIAEWRKITKTGSVILDNEETDAHPFVVITPIIVPHKLIGMSVADTAMESQRIKTHLLRSMLDGLNMSVNGRTYAVESQVNIDDLITNRPNDVVRVKSPDAVGPLITGKPDLQAGMGMLEFVETWKENRTGWTRYSQGTSSDALNQTATGVNIITNKGDMRVDMIARNFAETGVKALFNRILKLVCQYQDKSATLRLNDKWVEVSPSEWQSQFDMTVNVGLGTGNKDQIVQHLMVLSQVMERAAQAGVIKPNNVFNVIKKIAENMGFKNPELFATDPETMPPPMEQGPDPALEIEREKANLQAQSQIQVAQIKAQTDFEIAKMKEEHAVNVERYKTDNSLRIEKVRAKQVVEDDPDEEQGPSIEMQMFSAIAESLRENSIVLTNTMNQVASMAEALNAPKRVVRDKMGNVIGVESVVRG